MSRSCNLDKNQNGVEKYFESDFEKLMNRPIAWNECKIINPITDKQISVYKKSNMTKDILAIVKEQESLMPHKQIVYNAKIENGILIIKLIPITGAA